MTLSTLTRMSLTHCRRTSFQFALARMLRWYAKKMQDRISSWKRRKRQAGGRCVHTNTLRVKTHTWTHTSIHLSLNESTAGIKWMKRRSLSVWFLHITPIPITFIAFFICKERAWDAPGFQWLWSAVTLTVLQNEHDAVRCDVTPEAAVPHDHNLFFCCMCWRLCDCFQALLGFKKGEPIARRRRRRHGLNFAFTFSTHISPTLSSTSNLPPSEHARLQVLVKGAVYWWTAWRLRVVVEGLFENWN